MMKAKRRQSAFLRGKRAGLQAAIKLACAHHRAHEASKDSFRNDANISATVTAWAIVRELERIR